MTVRSTLTRVLGPTALRACWAACCGVSGTGDGTACTAARPSPAGSCIRVTLFELLRQTQAWFPSRIRSVSPISTGTESRICVGSAYQTLIVCDPASRDGRESGAEPGSCGMPSDAVSTTVPVRAGSGPVRPATEASSCAGVRAGSSGEAWAVLIMVPAVTAAARTTAPPGTAHLARRENVGSFFIPNLTRPRAGQPHRLVPGGRARPGRPARGPLRTAATLVRVARSLSRPV